MPSFSATRAGAFFLAIGATAPVAAAAQTRTVSSDAGGKFIALYNAFFTAVSARWIVPESGTCSKGETARKQFSNAISMSIGASSTRQPGAFPDVAAGVQSTLYCGVASPSGSAAMVIYANGKIATTCDLVSPRDVVSANFTIAAGSGNSPVYTMKASIKDVTTGKVCKSTQALQGAPIVATVGQIAIDPGSPLRGAFSDQSIKVTAAFARIDGVSCDFSSCPGASVSSVGFTSTAKDNHGLFVNTITTSANSIASSLNVAETNRFDIARPSQTGQSNGPR